MQLDWNVCNSINYLNNHNHNLWKQSDNSGAGPAEKKKGFLLWHIQAQNPF